MALIRPAVMGKGKGSGRRRAFAVGSALIVIGVWVGACQGSQPVTAPSTTASSISSSPSSTAPASSTITSAGTPSSTNAPSTTSALPEIIPGVAAVEYVDTQFGFSLDRPETTSVLSAGFDAYLPLTQTGVVAITLPETLFHGTNLIEAGVYIGASSSRSVISRWNVPVADSNEATAGTVELDGSSFAAFTSEGVAAGNIYEEKVYRALRDGTCFEIVELLHSGNIANYNPGTVVEFDKATFQGYLDAIVSTFAFTSR